MGPRNSSVPLGRVGVILALVLAAGFLILRPSDEAGDGSGGSGRSPPAERIRVEVFNAGGRTGMARAATLVLREAGFDVVDMGNAPPYEREVSIVLDRVGQLEWAQGVAEALGIQSSQTDPDSTRLVDVTVLLGADWEPFSAADSSGAGERETP